jgi:hypothetical protein
MAKVQRPKIRAGNAIGYKSPPRHTQFKKGQSGNAKGRPKGSLNIATVLAKTLREKLTVTENGRRKTITKLDAAVKQLVNKAATGDARAIQLLIGLSQAVEERGEAPDDARGALPEADQQVMKSLLTRIQQYANGGKK